MIDQVSDFLFADSGVRFTFKNNEELKIFRNIHTAYTFKPWLEDYLDKNLLKLPAIFLKLQEIRKSDRESFKGSSKELFQRLMDRARSEMEPTQKVDTGLTEVQLQSIQDLYPAQDVEDHERVTIRMFNTATKSLSDISFQHWKMVVDPKVFDARMRKPLPGVFQYDPYDPQKIINIEVTNYQVNRFNLYREPNWMGLEYSGKLPDLAKRFFLHLFPTPEVRAYIYTWMFHMLTRRARTYLYLPAAQKTGKTTFAYLCGALVGKENYQVGKQDFAETKFNSFVLNKRLIILDEYNCHKNDEKETLKRIINEEIQIEAKGVDQKTVKNYCSFIICNNNAEGIYVEPEDRRFSIPEMASTPLLQVFTEAEANWLNKEIENPNSQFIADIGFWILDKFKEPKFSSDYPWQKERFEEVVFASSREGMKFILDEIMARKKDKYTYEQMRSSYRAYTGNKNAPFPANFKVKDYLENFKHKGSRICTLNWDRIKLEITPTAEYMPEKKEEF